MYEREDFPLPFLALHTTPYIQMTEKVVEPRGEARQEWEVIEEIAGRIGITPSSSWPLRQLGRVGVKLSPRRLVDLLLRTGPKGDLFGLRRGGLSIKKLAENPHGIVLAEHLDGGVLPKQLRTKDNRVHLDAPEIARRGRAPEGGQRPRPAFPLRMIGLRELRSHNSWMHNAPLLMRGGRTHAARIHPDDAEALGLADGERCTVASAHGSIEIEAMRDRRDQAGHDRRPPRLGPSRRLEDRERRRRRERQRARLLRPGRPRAARRDGVPERDPGPGRAGCRAPSRRASSEAAGVA